jgi:hypothetical protein
MICDECKFTRAPHEHRCLNPDRCACKECNETKQYAKLLELQRQKRVLHLVLIEKWFEKILSGEKTEEYRAQVPFWFKRLFKNIRQATSTIMVEWDYVCFTHGYTKNARRFYIEFKGIEIREGKPEWGADPGQVYIVIKLGRIVHKNF